MGILLLLYQNVPDKTGKKMELFQKQMIMLKEKLKESLSVSSEEETSLIQPVEIPKLDGTSSTFKILSGMA